MLSCDEFRQTTQECFLYDVTRAQRAALVAHYQGCLACRRWLRAVRRVSDTLTPVSAAQQAQIDAEAAQLRQEDLNDPEFREVVDRQET